MNRAGKKLKGPRIQTAWDSNFLSDSRIQESISLNNEPFPVLVKPHKNLMDTEISVHAYRSSQEDKWFGSYVLMG